MHTSHAHPPPFTPQGSARGSLYVWAEEGSGLVVEDWRVGLQGPLLQVRDQNKSVAPKRKVWW